MHGLVWSGPVARNILPLDIRSAPTLSTFKSVLIHICSLVPTSLSDTDCFQSTSSEHCTAAKLVVTLAMLLRLINCRFIIIIIIIIIMLISQPESDNFTLMRLR